MSQQGKSTGLISPGFKTKRDTSVNRSVAGVWAAMDERAITVHQERCAKVRNRNVTCLKCAEACTSGCISLVEGKLVVDPTQCVGCGTCATVCPTSALEAHNPTDAELLGECVAAALRSKATGGVAEVALACQPVREALAGFVVDGTLVPVVCAGRVDESLLLGLVAQGVECVHVVCGDCGYCAQKYGLDTAHLVVETTRTLLNSWNASSEIVVGSKVPKSLLLPGVTVEQVEDAVTTYFSVDRSCPPIATAVVGASADSQQEATPLDERQEKNSCNASASVSHSAETKTDSFSSQPSASDSASVPASVAVSTCEAGSSNTGSTYKLLRVMKDGTLPHFIPDRRERLLDALACLPAPSADTVLETRLWGTVSIDAKKCSSCRLCATFCPTGAIRKFDLESGEFGIDHTPADCVNCGTCQDICPEEAIVLRESVAVTDLLNGTYVRHHMIPRAVSLRNNPHQIIDTFRQTFNGDIFER